MRHAIFQCFRLFYISHGVKQGERLSHILLILLVNNLHSELDNIDNPVRLLDIISLFMFMYADDMILLFKSENVLQTLLNKMVIYCERCGLGVNENKTKICV